MWRVHIEDDYRFSLDQFRVIIAKRDSSGDMAYIKPLTFETLPLTTIDIATTPLPDATLVTYMPRELAEVLLTALAHNLLGTEGSDIVATIHRLRRERDSANQRLDALIAGIGRMGGKE